MYEYEMYPLIKNIFEKDYFVDFEVPLLKTRKKVDVLCLSKTNDNNNEPELIAIEAKIKDWRRALRQAKSRLFSTDKVYIAIYYKNITKNVLINDFINNFNVGVIAVDGTATIIKKAEKSKLTMENRKERMIKIMEKNLVTS